jgi:hypothetical protein
VSALPRCSRNAASSANMPSTKLFTMNLLSPHLSKGGGKIHQEGESESGSEGDGCDGKKAF